MKTYPPLLQFIHVSSSAGILMYAEPFIGGFNLDPRRLDANGERRMTRANSDKSKLGLGLMRPTHRPFQYAVNKSWCNKLLESWSSLSENLGVVIFLHLLSFSYEDTLRQLLEVKGQ